MSVYICIQIHEHALYRIASMEKDGWKINGGIWEKGTGVNKWYKCSHCDYYNHRAYHCKMHFVRIHVNNGRAIPRRRKYHNCSEPVCKSNDGPEIEIKTMFSAKKSNKKSKKQKSKTNDKYTSSVDMLVNSHTYAGSTGGNIVNDTNKESTEEKKVENQKLVNKKIQIYSKISAIYNCTKSDELLKEVLQVRYSTTFPIDKDKIENKYNMPKELKYEDVLGGMFDDNDIEKTIMNKICNEVQVDIWEENICTNNLLIFGESNINWK